jgi:hypothetical protein
MKKDNEQLIKKIANGQKTISKINKKIIIIAFVIILIFVSLAYYSYQKSSTYIYQPRYYLDWRLQDSFEISGGNWQYIYVSSIQIWKMEWQWSGLGVKQFSATLHYDNYNVFETFNEMGTIGYKEYHPGIESYDYLKLEVHDGSWFIKIYTWDLGP